MGDEEALPAARGVRVAVVASTCHYVFDSWIARREQETGRGCSLDRSLTATGALFASFAIIRHCIKVADAVLIAVTGRDKADEKLGAPGAWDSWEGEPVYCGSSDEVMEVLGAILAEHGAFDVAISPDSLSDVVELCARVPAKRRFAFCHTFIECPFGPFGGFQADAEGRRAALESVELLCPSESLTSYVRRWSSDSLSKPCRVRPCPLACVHYFGAPTIEGLPSVHDVADGRHIHIMVISACPAKGLSLILPLAKRFKDWTFAVCATAWTTPDIQEYLRFFGIKVFRAVSQVSRLYRECKVLLAPSLWPEVYGLVAMEAGLRGIPCISSRSGGLVEANPLHPELTVETPLVFDVASQAYATGVTLQEVEDAGGKVEYSVPVMGDTEAERTAVGQFQEAIADFLNAPGDRVRLLMHQADDAVVEPYAALLQRLLEDDAYYRWASCEARERALRAVMASRTSFVDLLRAAE